MCLSITDNVVRKEFCYISGSVSIEDPPVWISKCRGDKKEAEVELLLKFQSSHN